MLHKTKSIAICAVVLSAIVGISAISTVDAQSNSVPSWIKNIAGFWADGQTTDADFLNAIEYLVDNGLIKAGGSQSLDVDTLTIGFIPVEKADELTPKAEELAKFLEDRLPGVDVKIVVPSNYETIIEGMRFGHIDAAFMDTGPAWITHQRAGAEAILAEVVGGQINYQATVWAKIDDNSIKTVEDTLGKRVAFTSITGSSGFVRPMGALVTSGAVDVQGDDIIALEKALSNSFKAHTFAGGYKAALELLINGNVDAAFGSDIAATKYLEPADQAKIKAVATIGPVPSHVVMVSADMSDNTKEALRDALVELNYNENNAILTDLYGAEALLPTTTEQHIGDFGKYLDALTGLDQVILDKYNKSK